MQFPLRAPAPQSASACTCSRMRRLTRRLTALYDEHLAAAGLRVTQYALLVTLNKEGGAAGVTLSDLASAMDMDRTTLTRNLKPLESQRLVKIAADASDGRARRARITPGGLKALNTARAGWRAAQSQVARTLGNANVEALHGWIDSVMPAFRAGVPARGAVE